MYRVILENKYDYDNRSFALCQSCYWTVTIFTKIESYECPVCRDKNVELIPLKLDEKYEYQLEPDKGLAIKFSINEEIRDLKIEDYHILMEHPEIRFQILYYLYNKYYGGQTRKLHSIEKIIQETELKNIDRNLINADIGYLYSSDLVTGKGTIGNGGYPPSIIIINKGIDLVENIINEIIVNIRNQQSTTIVKNEIELISKSDQRTRSTKVWNYVKAKPELFVNIREKVLKLFLGAGY